MKSEIFYLITGVLTITFASLLLLNRRKNKVQDTLSFQVQMPRNTLASRALKIGAMINNKQMKSKRAPQKISLSLGIMRIEGYDDCKHVIFIAYMLIVLDALPIVFVILAVSFQDSEFLYGLLLKLYDFGKAWRNKL